MSSFDSDNDFLHEETYYETNGNYFSANGVYQGESTKQKRIHNFPRRENYYKMCENLIFQIK